MQTVKPYSNLISASWKVYKAYGFRNLIHQLFTNHDPKIGTIVGEDTQGNRFFESQNEILNRDRWVEQPTKFKDGSAIDPEWQTWLARQTDIPAAGAKLAADGPVRPADIKGQVPKFHTFSFPMQSGEPGVYRPYNTVRPKYESWTPESRPRA